MADDIGEWSRAVGLAELARRKRLQVTVGDQTIALFLVDGEVFALRDSCVHKQKSLSKGTVLHGRIICPGHQWRFDPATGRADGQTPCQPTYDVRVEDDTVFVDPRPRLVPAAPSPQPDPAEAT